MAAATAKRLQLCQTMRGPAAASEMGTEVAQQTLNRPMAWAWALGASPAEMPIQLATEFELVVNLQTADGLGIAIPATVLLRADEVIE